MLDYKARPGIRGEDEQQVCEDIEKDMKRDNKLSRRDFFRSAAAAGVSLAISRLAAGESAQTTDELKVALIGAGSQGRNLIINCLKIPSVRFVAVVDIWPYHQRYASNILRKYNHQVNVYADCREMLASESDLDAAIIASPDWVHAEQTIACLEAGLHVYCEKEMSNTIEGAAGMVKAARKTGKLLQIGHQRRSNPRYAHGLRLIEKDKLLGRITHCYGQWNRARRLDLGWPRGQEIDGAALKKYGYDTMERFRNWRWYRKYSGGPIADLGSHQVDVFNWFLRTAPASVIASGGRDYYPDREWYDNVMAIYEYSTPQGPCRAFYQVLNTTSHGGFYETFMGDEGSLVISEDIRKGLIFRELQAKRQEWENEAEKVESMGQAAIELKIGETLDASGAKDPEAQKLAAEAKKPVHQLHLENFFNAIRGRTKLTCPPEVAFETTVSVLRANDAVAGERKIVFNPDEFKVHA